jgi:hypothetical protein
MPNMHTPIENLIQTTVVGAAYCKETFVATKEAPHTMTAKRALRIAFVFIRCKSTYSRAVICFLEILPKHFRFDGFNLASGASNL